MRNPSEANLTDTVVGKISPRADTLFREIATGLIRHLHAFVRETDMIVSASGFAPVTTHLFVAGDPYLDSDAVFAVKQSLIVDFVPHAAGPTPDGADSAVPFCTATYDLRLVSQAG